MKAPEHDVLVVGAGPAGCAAGYRLASAAARVALLDAAGFPRDKACGDALSPGATPLLAEFGVADELARRGAPVISEWRLRSSDGTWFAGRYTERGSSPSRGFAVERRVLDGLLAEAAVRVGARLYAGQRVFAIERAGAGWRVRTRGPGGQVHAWRGRVLIGADGLRSRIARLVTGVRSGPHPRLAIVGRLGAPGLDSRHGELRIGRGDPFVMGSAPLGDGRFNVTLVARAARARDLSGATESYFREGMASLGADPALVSGRLERKLGVTGPFRVSPRSVAGPAWFLAGDAAGYFDPFTGQGIYRALRTGALAGEAALTLLGGSGATSDRIVAARYAADVRSILAPSRFLQYAIDASIRRERLFDLLAGWLSSRPEMTARIMDVTGDRLAPIASLYRPLGAANRS